MRTQAKWQANWQLRFPDDAKTAVLNPQLATIPDLGHSFAMILLPLLASVLMPSDAAIMKAAEKCGFQKSQLIWSTDAAGRRHADVTPNGDPDSVPFPKIECIMRWNAEHQVKIGFVARSPEASAPSR